MLATLLEKLFGRFGLGLFLGFTLRRSLRSWCWWHLTCLRLRYRRWWSSASLLLFQLGLDRWQSSTGTRLTIWLGSRTTLLATSRGSTRWGWWWRRPLLLLLLWLLTLVHLLQLLASIELKFSTVSQLVQFGNFTLNVLNSCHGMRAEQVVVQYGTGTMRLRAAWTWWNGVAVATRIGRRTLRVSCHGSNSVEC